ncbi:MAG: hypothetical protein J5854_03615 [Clostridia bacterium]|nr:hypothetical protein [Clostridia bacterium]
MKRYLMIITAAVLALAALSGCASCGKKVPDAETGAYTPTAKEAARITELARAFRIYGEFNKDDSFPASKTENMIYCLYTCALPESDIRGYGKVAITDTDELIARMLGLDASGIVRTKYKPNEVQLVYTVGDYYYIYRTDDSDFTYEITEASVVRDDSGARTGVRATVKITDSEGAFSIVFELADDDKLVFTVDRSSIQYYK